MKNLYIFEFYYDGQHFLDWFWATDEKKATALFKKELEEDISFWSIEDLEIDKIKIPENVISYIKGQK